MVAIYISIRFEPKMALAAFIAMIHDVLVAVGIYSIFNFQVTPDTVVAILTILGYSLYDTVVVFDRVRDNTKGIGSSGRLTYPQLINLSMNQTLARSINTSMVAILPVLAVLLIGAQLLGATTLQSYGLALFVGLLSGAYSSIFIASPVLCMMKEREDRWVADRQPPGQAGRGPGRRTPPLDAATMSTADERGGLRPGEPGRGGRRAEVRQHQAQRADPAGLGQRRGRRRWRRRRDGGTGPAVGATGPARRRPSASGGSGSAAPGPRPRKSKGKSRRNAERAARPAPRARRVTFRYFPWRVAWMDGGPDPGDSVTDAAERRSRLEQAAASRCSRDLLAPLLAEFARHRPEDDTALIVEAGRTAAHGPRGPVPALGRALHHAPGRRGDDRGRARASTPRPWRPPSCTTPWRTPG